MKEKKKTGKMTSIGGQAVLEGIMMRGPKKNALAVRLPDGTISMELLESKAAKDVFKPCGWPFFRGIVGMVESFALGYKALMKSAEKLGIDEEEEKEAAQKKKNKALKKAQKKAEKNGEAVNVDDIIAEEEAKEAARKKKEEDNSGAFFSILMSFASVLGVAMALVLFMWVPVLIFNFLKDKVFIVANLLPYKGLIEGCLKIAIFLVYIYLVTKMKDIHRTFQYHGAEHKTIFCYEAGQELTVENVEKFKRFHPRCGTSFLVLILIVSILISTIVLFIFPALNKITWLWIIIKILLIPVICGVGYEINRACARHPNLFTKIVIAPGLWVQRLTTKEPDDSMMEIAIAALKEVIPENPEDDNL